MVRLTVFRARVAACAAATGLVLSAVPPHSGASPAIAPSPASAPLAQTAANPVSAGSTTTVPELRTDVIDLGPGTVDGATGRVYFDLDPVDAFVAIGASWTGPRALDAEAVLRYATGESTDVIELNADEAHGEDGARADNTTVTTDPAALDRPAVAIHLSLDPGATAVQVHLIREIPGTGIPLAPSATFDQATADGIPGPDGIRTRAAWGAAPRKQTDSCANTAYFEGRGCVSSTGVGFAVIHHTVNSNNYSAASVPALLRSIQAYHQGTQNWDDIGYNLVVDRFGTIWEARAGGVDRPVVGGHTTGFNTGSVGIAVLGDFTSGAPSAATVEAIARIAAWKLAQRNVDPLGQVSLISGGGDKFEKGLPVVVNAIDGHRSMQLTSCPGAALFALLPQIRARAAQLLPVYTGEFTTVDLANGQVKMSGYALRRDTATPVAVRLTVDGVDVGQDVANRPRTDVAQAFPALGANHGFEFVIPVTPNAVQACVFESLSGELIGCRDVNPLTPPQGAFGFSTTSSPPRIGLSGWAYDPDSSQSTVVHVYVDGVYSQLIADRSRPDVAEAIPIAGPNRGFAADYDVSPGPHQVCVYAINLFAGPHVLLECQVVDPTTGVTATTTTPSPTVNTAAPRGSLDLVQGGGARLLVRGWALDVDTKDPLNVHVYVDGELHTGVTAVPRPDVVAVFPGSPANSGFAMNIGATAGSHRVCVYAIDANLVGPHTTLGCRTVTVLPANATPPEGNIDVITTAPGGVVVAGWTIDPDTPDPIAVHIYIDGTGYAVTANLERTDVAKVFANYGARHGFDNHITVGPGQHQVCVYAINNNNVGAHTLLGCRQVTV